MYRCAAEQLQQDGTIRVALLGSAVLALILGTSIYLLDRDWASTLFLSSWAQWQDEPGEVFGALGLVLPSFFHAYAFALLLIMTLGRTTRARRFGASAWFAIAAVLELLQAGQVPAVVTGAEAAPVVTTLFNSLQHYVMSGHFDPGDLIAAGIGCLAAYVVSSALEVDR